MPEANYLEFAPDYIVIRHAGRWAMRGRTSGYGEIGSGGVPFFDPGRTPRRPWGFCTGSRAKMHR